MSATVDMMRAYLAEVGLDRPHVAGNSLGGAIALEMAVAGLASSATAISPAGFYTDRYTSYMQKRAEEQGKPFDAAAALKNDDVPMGTLRSIYRQAGWVWRKGSR